jgi:hypothetical protein
VTLCRDPVWWIHQDLLATTADGLRIQAFFRGLPNLPFGSLAVNGKAKNYPVFLSWIDKCQNPWPADGQPLGRNQLGAKEPLT